MAFSPDGATLATASVRSPIRLWDRTGKLLRTLAQPAAAVLSLVFSPDGKSLEIVTGTKGKGMPLSLLQEVPSGKRKPSLQNLTQCLNWQTLFLDGRPAPPSEPLRPERLNAPVNVLAGMNEAMSLMMDGVVVLKGGMVVPMCLALSPDRKLLAVGGMYTPIPVQGNQAREGGVLVWDLTADKMQGLLRGHAGPVNSLAFTRDGRTLASGGFDGKVKLWDVGKPGGPARLSLKAHNPVVVALVFSPDGKTLTSAGGDALIAQWNTATGQREATYKGHLHGIASVAVAAKDGLLASASLGGEVKLWAPSPR